MIIKNGDIFLPGFEEPQNQSLLIEDGRISSVSPTFPPARHEIDATGLLVLPGAIDPHVHFNEPGFTEREDFYHGSCAAASGGVTTIIDMPCTSLPPVTDIQSLQQKVDIVENRSVVDFGLFAGISASSFRESGLDQLNRIGADVCGFKAYLHSGMETFPHLDHPQLRTVLARSSEFSRPVLLHAEDAVYVRKASLLQQQRGKSPREYYLSRPEQAEILAIRKAVELAEEVAGNLHIVHISTEEGAQCLRGTAVTGETAPHYLAFDLDDFQDKGSMLKVAPSLKPGNNREGLWQALQDRTLSFIASDHAPCPAASKSTGSIWSDYSGISGVSTLLPYMYSEGYRSGKISLSLLVELTSTAAARRFGLFQRKGTIEQGKDADLVFIDPHKTWTVRGNSFLSKGKLTPFEGMTFKGQIVRTMVRGETVYTHDRGIVVQAGHGLWLKPSKQNREK